MAGLPQETDKSGDQQPDKSIFVNISLDARRGVVEAFGLLTGLDFHVAETGSYENESGGVILDKYIDELLITFLKDPSREPSGKIIELTPWIKQGFVKLAEAGGHVWIPDGDGWKDKETGADIPCDVELTPLILRTYF
ncbi:MAG TPA: hypothetical protein VMR81_01665 [Patescibacteria group bacterium]|nr:hypothetical protein [Patescibacteria group bacterium]